MNRYLVFKYSCYDEEGGWRDFSSAHDDIVSAIAAAEKYDGNEIADVVDLAILKVVETRYLWHSSHIMVDGIERAKLRKQEEEWIAARQREQGLIA